VKAELYPGEVRMLFAVIAVAAVPIVGAFASARSAPAAAPIILVQPFVVEVAGPRVMPSGAPACGNVTARPIPGVMPCEGKEPRPTGGRPCVEGMTPRTTRVGAAQRGGR